MNESGGFIVIYLSFIWILSILTTNFAWAVTINLQWQPYLNFRPNQI